LINGNVNNNPVTTTGNWTFLYSVEWSAGTTYKEGSVITYQNLLYQSLQNSNLNKNPLTEPTYWVLISLAYVSTTTYTAGQNVVGPDGVFYTALRTTIGDTPASSPSDWVGTSAAAAASATAALASQVAAAASASTATTQAGLSSASAATATTQAGLASSSASAASSSASSASSSASSATSSASSATSSASSAAASAAAALVSENAAELAEANATAIVYGGGFSVTAVAGNVPIADTSAKIGNDWLYIGTGPNEFPLNQMLGSLSYYDHLPMISYPNTAPTIASASTIIAQTPVAFVSGTTNVVTIQVPPSMQSGGGQITLIPTGLWSTTTAGNIGLATTAVVSKALTLTYDSATAKWYPSY
jgi:hypothetical protein